VSPRAYHKQVEDLDEDEESGALIVEDVVFDNLSVVLDGASPSNSVEIGGMDGSPDAVAAMSSASNTGAFATLSRGAPDFDELAETQFDTGDWVQGDSSGGTWHGKVRDMKTDGCFSDKIDGDQEICASEDEPVYLIENYDPESGEFTETMVAHLEGSVRKWDHSNSTDNEEASSALNQTQDEAELGLYPIKLYGPVSAPEFVDSGAVEDVVDQLQSHDAIKAAVASGDVADDIYIIIDSNVVDDNESLNEHIITTLEDTPYDVWDGWSWIDSSQDTLAASTLDGVTSVTTAVEELEVSDETIDDVYAEWDDHVNMTASELDEWSDHPCADTASQDPETVRERNMMLLETDKSDWGQEEVDAARRTISFISRMSASENEPDNPKDGGANGCPSEWAVSLLNWAHNPFDSLPDVPEDMVEENAQGINYEAANGAVWFEVPDPESEVISPVNFVTGTHGFRVESSTEPARQGHGHLVVLVNNEFVDAGETVPSEDGYVHLSDGATKFELDLPAGEHTLRLQAVDANHRAYDLRDKVDVRVVEPPEMSEEGSKHGSETDEEEMASINGVDVNGLVMFDGDMGSIAGFEERDGSLMVEVEIIEQDDGQFQKTGETEMVPLQDTESMRATGDGSVAELEAAWHTPEWSGLDAEREWSKPNMEDFDTDDMSEISDHFVVSKTGEWPPENYGDLALPVVFPNGDLSLDGLDSAHQMAQQVDGLSDEMATAVQEKLNSWADEHFDQQVAGEELTLTVAQTQDTTIGCASTSDDDPTLFTASTLAVADTAISGTNTTTTNTMTEIEYDEASESDIAEMNDPVVLEREDVEELRESASDAEELSTRLDQMNSSLTELAEDKEVLDSLDDNTVESLREYDSPVVLTESEHEELSGLVDDVGQIYAEELADFSPFSAEELQERFDPTELREKVEEHDEASVEAELASGGDPDPKGGSKSTDELGSNGDGVSEDELREGVARQLEGEGYTRQAQKVRDGEIALDELGIDTDTIEA
jgi:hypothetical protein